MTDAQKDRLKELEQFLVDAAAFINWAYDHGKVELIRPTLAHDISGLASRDEPFCTRVRGFNHTRAEAAKLPADMPCPVCNNYAALTEQVGREGTYTCDCGTSFVAVASKRGDAPALLGPTRTGE